MQGRQHKDEIPMPAADVVKLLISSSQAPNSWKRIFYYRQGMTHSFEPSETRIRFDLAFSFRACFVMMSARTREP